MALGSNNQQNNRGLSEPNYYSRLRFKNEEDKLQIGFTYWKGTLKISITERTNGDNPRSDELAYIHLSPSKARIMAEFVQQVIDDPTITKQFGINTGASDTQGVLAIARDNGRPYLMIAKVNKDGKFENCKRFNFANNYNYGLEFSDFNKLSFTKQYDNDLELRMFKDILEDYARSANGAIGASTWDVARYEISKMNNQLNQIAEKVGADRRSGGNYGGNANDSYFANSNSGSSSSAFSSGMNKPTSYTTGSIEDMDSEFE